MPDAIFAHPRLAAVYDAFDGHRDDLDFYVGVVEELAADLVLDVGCGTGKPCGVHRHALELISAEMAPAWYGVVRRGIMAP